MKHPVYRKARTALALLLAAAVALGLSACGRGAGTQVAGADQQVIYGYVLEVNEQARSVTVDPVELVAAEDVQRMNRLGLEATLSGRSYAYNARRNYVMYALDRAADFDFGDEGAPGGETANLTGNGQPGDSAANDGGGLFGGSGLMGGNDNAGNGGNSGNNAGSGAEANRVNSESGNTGEPGGNSVSGNTSVGGGTAYSGTAGTASDTATDTASGSSGNAAGGNADNGAGQGNGGGQNNGGSVNAGPYADGGSGSMGGPGYGYTGVRGGLFTGLNDRFDRLNAYIRQYDDLLCRLVLENGAVTKITVCTGDNL